MQKFKIEPLKLPKIKEVPGWRLDTVSPKLILQPLVLSPFKVSSKKELNISPRYPKSTRLPKLIIPITPKVEENTDQYLLENKLYKLDLPEHIQRDQSFLYSRRSYSGSSLSENSNLIIPSIEFSYPLSGTRTQMSLNKNEHIKSFKGSEELSGDVSGNFNEFNEATKKFQASKMKFAVIPPEKESDQVENLTHQKKSGKNKEKRIKQFKTSESGLTNSDFDEAKGFVDSKISLSYPKDSEESGDTFKILNEYDEQMSLGNLNYDILKPFNKAKDSSRMSENLILDHKVYLKRKSFDDYVLKNDNNTLPERFFSESNCSFSETEVEMSLKNESGESLQLEDRKWKSVQYRIDCSSQSSDYEFNEDGIGMEKSKRHLNVYDGQHLKNSDEIHLIENDLKHNKNNINEKKLLNVGKFKVLEISAENHPKSNTNTEKIQAEIEKNSSKLEEKSNKPEKRVKKDEETNKKNNKQQKKPDEKTETSKNNQDLNPEVNKEPINKQVSTLNDKLESSKTIKPKKSTKTIKKNTNPGKKLTKPNLAQQTKKKEKLQKNKKTQKTEKVQLYKVNGKEMQINIKELTAHNSPQSPDSSKELEIQQSSMKDQPKPQDDQISIKNASKQNSTLLKSSANLARQSLKLPLNQDSLKNSSNLTGPGRLSLKLVLSPDTPKNLSNSAKVSMKQSLNPDSLKKSPLPKLRSDRDSSIDSLISIMKKNPINSFIQNFSASLLKTIRTFSNKKTLGKGPKKKPEKTQKKSSKPENIKSSSSNIIEKSITESPSMSENKEKLGNSSTSNFISKASLNEQRLQNLSLKNSDLSLQSKASVFSKYKSGKKHYIKKLEVSLNSKNSSISVIKKDFSDSSSSISYEESESLDEDSDYMESDVSEESEEESLEFIDMEQRLRNSAMYELQNYELIKNMAMSIYENNVSKGKDSELLGRNPTLKLDSVTEIDESKSREQEKPQNDISKSDFNMFFAKPVENFIFFKDEKGSIIKKNKNNYKMSEKLEEEPESEIKARAENKKSFLKNLKNSQSGFKNAEYAFLEIIPTEEFITEKLKLGKNSRLLKIDQNLKPQKNS